jgi:hypothetical protein
VPANPALPPAIIGSAIPPGYVPVYQKAGGTTLSSIAGDGLNDDFYAGIQYTDIFATPTVVPLGSVSVGSATGNAGPSATVLLFNQFGIASTCSAVPTVVATPAGSVTVTQIGSTNGYLIQLGATATNTPGFINATATFTCAGAENSTTVAISATVLGPLNLAPTATLSGFEVFNTGVLTPWNTLGLTLPNGDASIPVSVTTPFGTQAYTTSIPAAGRSTNYPTCTLFSVSGGGTAGVPSGAPSTFNVVVSSTCAALLNPGVYFANAQVSSLTASNSAQLLLPLSLTVTAGTILSQGVGPLTFSSSQIPQQSAFTVVANNGTVNYGINYISGGANSPNGFALPGGNVSIVTGISGTIIGGGSQSIVVQVSPVGLAKGVYSGTFQVVQVNPTTNALVTIQNFVLTIYVGQGLGVIRPSSGSLTISVPTGFQNIQIAQPFAPGSATGPTSLAAIALNPPTIAVTGLDNTSNTPYVLAAPVFAWTGTAPPANPVTGASSEVTITPGAGCSTWAPSPQLAGNQACAFNVSVDTVGITVPATFNGTITFAATAATGGATVQVPITLNVTAAPTLLSTNCPAEARAGGVTTGPACVVPSGTTPATTVAFTALTGTVPPGGFNTCQFVDVYATGGVVPGVTATLSSAWASFNDVAFTQSLILGNLTTTGVLNQPAAPVGLPVGGFGFPICVNQSLAPQGAGTVSTLITIQGSGVGTITIPVTFITSPNSPGAANFKQIGIFRNSIAGVAAGFVLDSSGTNNYVASDKARLFGQPGDIPVAGDFFGTGTIEIGVFRCPTGATVCQWFIDANNSGTWDGPFGGDQIWNFGIPGDIPVVGDWNGNGTSKIGIFRCPAAGSTTPCTWVLDAGNKHVYDGATAVIAYYGLAGDMPVVNNWNATGTVDQIGVFRGNGTWIVDSNGSNTWEASDAQYTYGLTGDKPVVGNWNGTGRKRIGVFRPSAGIWVLNLSGTNAWLPIDAVGNFGTVGDQPIVGLWTLP